MQRKRREGRVAVLSTPGEEKGTSGRFFNAIQARQRACRMTPRFVQSCTEREAKSRVRIGVSVCRVSRVRLLDRDQHPLRTSALTIEWMRFLQL